MTSRSMLRVAVGGVLVVVGVALVLSPEWVRDALDRPAESVGERINLRATFGGTVLGVGALVLHASALKPVKVLLFKALIWLMVGIGAARLVGFALDGRPDRMQITWIVAEVVLAALGVVLLRRARARA